MQTKIKSKKYVLWSVERGICPIAGILEFYFWFWFLLPFPYRHRHFILYRRANFLQIATSRDLRKAWLCSHRRIALSVCAQKLNFMKIASLATEVRSKTQIQDGGGRHLEFYQKCDRKFYHSLIKLRYTKCISSTANDSRRSIPNTNKDIKKKKN